MTNKKNAVIATGTITVALVGFAATLTPDDAARWLDVIKSNAPLVTLIALLCGVLWHIHEQRSALKRCEAEVARLRGMVERRSRARPP